MATTLIKLRGSVKADVLVTSADNCDNLNSPEVVYYWGYNAGAPVNAPVSGAGELIYIKTPYARLQVARAYNSISPIYMRMYYSGVWQGWVRFTAIS